MRLIFLAVLLSGSVFLGSYQSATPATQPTTQPQPVPTSSPAPTPTTSPPTATPTIPVGVNIGNRAPDFQLTTLTGDNISLSDFSGKPVLLNFWATWCGPCKVEMPYLQQIHDAYSSQGLVLLAVDYAEKPETVRSFMTSNNLSLTIPMDTDGKVTKSYLVTGIPRTLFIDKDGIIRGIMPGNFPNKEAIESMLTSIMP